MAHGSVSTAKFRIRKYQTEDDTRRYFVLESAPNGKTREIPFQTGIEALMYKNDRKNSVKKHQVFSRCKKCHTKRKHDASCPFYKQPKETQQSNEGGQCALPSMNSTSVSSTEKDVSSSHFDGGSSSSTTQRCDDNMECENQIGAIHKDTQVLKLYIEEFWETINEDLPSRKINMKACAKDQAKLNKKIRTNRFPFPNPLFWGKQPNISNAKSACAFFLMESTLVAVDPVMFYHDRFENEYSCQKWTCPKCDRVVGEAITSVGWQPNFRIVNSKIIDGNIDKVLKVAQYKHISCESVFSALDPKLIKQFPIEVQHEVGAIVNDVSCNRIDISWGTFVRAATAAGFSFKKRSETQSEMEYTPLPTFEHSFLHAQATKKRRVKGTISGVQKAPRNKNKSPASSVEERNQRKKTLDVPTKPDFSSLKSTCPGCDQRAAKSGGRIKHLINCEFPLFRHLLGDTKLWPYQRSSKQSWFHKCVLLFEEFQQCNLKFDNDSVANFRDNHAIFKAKLKAKQACQLDVVQERTKDVVQERTKDVVQERTKDVVQERTKDVVQERTKDVVQESSKSKNCDNSVGQPAWECEIVTSDGCCGYASVAHYLYEIKSASEYVQFAQGLLQSNWGIKGVQPIPGVPLEEGFGNLVQLENKFLYYIYKISRIGVAAGKTGWPALDSDCWMSFSDDLIVQSLLFNCQFFVYLNPIKNCNNSEARQQLVLVRPFLNQKKKLESKWFMKSRIFNSDKFVSADILLAAAQDLVDEADNIANSNGWACNGTYHWLNLGVSGSGNKLNHFEPLLAPSQWQVNGVPSNYKGLVHEHCKK